MGSKKNRSKNKSSAPSSGTSSPSISSAPPPAFQSRPLESADDVRPAGNPSLVGGARTVSTDSTECVDTTGSAEVKSSGAECESVGGNIEESSAGMNPVEDLDREVAHDMNGDRDVESKVESSNGYSDCYGNKEGENDSVSNMPSHGSTGFYREVSHGSGSECFEGGGSTEEVVSGPREVAAEKSNVSEFVVRELKQQLADAEVEIQKLREELAEAIEGKEIRETRLAELQGNVREGLKALELERGNGASLKEQAAAAQEREECLRNEVTENLRVVQGLQTKLGSMEVGMQDLQKENSKIQSEMKGVVENRDTELGNLEARRQQEVDKLQKRLAEMESSEAAHAAEVKAQRDRADVAERKLAEVQAGQSNGEGGAGVVAEMEKELSALRSWKGKAEEKLKKKETEVELLKRTCAEKENGIRALGCQLQQLLEESSGLHNDLLGVHENREAIIKKAREMDSSVMNCAAENEMLKIELMQMSKRGWGMLSLTTLFAAGALSATAVVLQMRARREGL